MSDVFVSDALVEAERRRIALTQVDGVDQRLKKLRQVQGEMNTVEAHLLSLVADLYGAVRILAGGDSS